MKTKSKMSVRNMTLIFLTVLSIQLPKAQQVEVQGELKVSQMTANDTQDNLVVRNPDGTLGTRSAASLPPPAPPIDSTRNLASDFELAKHLCDCPNLPPFMIKKLLESGYTPEELVGSGIGLNDVIDAQRMGVMIDYRNNKSYKTVMIGTQTWMAENLNYGTRIDGVDNQLNNSIIEKYCFDNDPSNCDESGGLYQWDEMMGYSNTPAIQGICPDGWHIPTDAELKTLEIELGMTPAQSNNTGGRGTNEGSKLAGNESSWTNGLLDQNSAFDVSGFGLPGAGYRNVNNGSFLSQGVQGNIWSSTSFSTVAYNRTLVFLESGIYRITPNKSYGYSVRCLKD